MSIFLIGPKSANWPLVILKYIQTEIFGHAKSIGDVYFHFQTDLVRRTLDFEISSFLHNEVRKTYISKVWSYWRQISLKMKINITNRFSMAEYLCLDIF